MRNSLSLLHDGKSEGHQAAPVEGLFLLTGASLMEVIPYLREVSSFAVGMFLLLIKTISGFGSKVLNALRFFLKEIPYKKL